MKKRAGLLLKFAAALAFLALARDPNFEIESHGYFHRTCSVSGRGKWVVKGTRNPAEAVDELELNARKIELLTGCRPRFHRPGGAYVDETCAALRKAVPELRKRGYKFVRLDEALKL